MILPGAAFVAGQESESAADRNRFTPEFSAAHAISDWRTDRNPAAKSIDVSVVKAYRVDDLVAAMADRFDMTADDVREFFVQTLHEICWSADSEIEAVFDLAGDRLVVASNADGQAGVARKLQRMRQSGIRFVSAEFRLLKIPAGQVDQLSLEQPAEIAFCDGQWPLKDRHFEGTYVPAEADPGATIRQRLPDVSGVIQQPIDVAVGQLPELTDQAIAGIVSGASGVETLILEGTSRPYVAGHQDGKAQTGVVFDGTRLSLRSVAIGNDVQLTCQLEVADLIDLKTTADGASQLQIQQPVTETIRLAFGSKLPEGSTLVLGGFRPRPVDGNDTDFLLLVSAECAEPIRPDDPLTVQQSKSTVADASVVHCYPLNDSAGQQGDARSQAPALRTLALQEKRRVIVEATGADVWLGSGGNGIIVTDSARGRLVVRQSPDVHRKIAAVAASSWTVRSYSVADLVVPLGNSVTFPLTSDVETPIEWPPVRTQNAVSPPADRGSRKTAAWQPEAETLNWRLLMDMIMATVDPDSWTQSGGQGTISISEPTLGLVIRQKPSAHDRITELLGKIRTLRQPQVSMEVDVIRLQDSQAEELMGLMQSASYQTASVFPDEVLMPLWNSAAEQAESSLRRRSRVILFDRQQLKFRYAPDRAFAIEPIIVPERLEVLTGLPQVGTRSGSSVAVPNGSQLLIDATHAIEETDKPLLRNDERLLIRLSPTILIEEAEMRLP